MINLLIERAEKEELIKVLNKIFEDEDISFISLELKPMKSEKNVWLELNDPIAGQLFTLSAPGLKLVPKN